MTLIDKAVMLATQAHAGQKRKCYWGGSYLPYLVHPLDVLKRVWTWGAASEVVGAAAVLHDVYEDCPSFDRCWVKDLSLQVDRLVEELTRWPADDKAVYLRAFRDPGLKSAEALVIKMADRISNVRDFMFNDLTYARVYLRKGDVLWLALRERFEELGRKLGSNVAGAMRAEWLDLADELT